MILTELLLHMVLAHFWNRRAGELVRNVAA